jgi:hypothetical protein
MKESEGEMRRLLDAYSTEMGLAPTAFLTVERLIDSHRRLRNINAVRRQEEKKIDEIERKRFARRGEKLAMQRQWISRDRFLFDINALPLGALLEKYDINID